MPEASRRELTKMDIGSRQCIGPVSMGRAQGLCIDGKMA
jgi:hypothetical protein